MNNTIELSAHRGYGGGKPYIARISGADSKFGIARDFLAARASSSKSGATGNVTATVTLPGLYEICDTDKKGKDSSFRVIIHVAEEGLVSLPVKTETAHEIAAGAGRRKKTRSPFAAQKQRRQVVDPQQRRRTPLDRSAGYRTCRARESIRRIQRR